MLVRNIMSPHTVTVTPADRAWTAADLLARLELTGLPVVDAEHGVLGIVSELDLIRAMRRGEDLHQVTVGAVMRRRPLFVTPETHVNDAADLLDEWQVRRLPVCEDGRLVGIVSRADILRALMADQLTAAR